MNVPLLNQSMTRHYDKQFPLGIMPVLPFGDAWFADVDADLAAVGSVYQLRKRASVVHIHLQRIFKLLRRKIRQIQTVQLLRERTLRHLRHHQRRRLLFKGFQQIHNLAQRHFVGNGNTAVASLRIQDRIHAVKLTMDFFPFQKIEHPFHQVVNIEKLQLGAPVIYMEFFIVGNSPAEGADSAVVLRPGVAHQVRKSVNRYPGPSFSSIGEKQILSSFLGSAIFRIPKASCQGGLDGGRQHNRGLVIILLQGVQKRTGKAEISLHKIFGILRTVHTRQVEHEVRRLAVSFQLFWGGVHVILINVPDLDSGAGTVFVFFYIFQIGYKGSSHHALGAGY